MLPCRFVTSLKGALLPSQLPANWVSGWWMAILAAVTMGSHNRQPTAVLALSVPAFLTGDSLVVNRW